MAISPQSSQFDEDHRGLQAMSKTLLSVARSERKEGSMQETDLLREVALSLRMLLRHAMTVSEGGGVPKRDMYERIKSLDDALGNQPVVPFRRPAPSIQEVRVEPAAENETRFCKEQGCNEIHIHGKGYCRQHYMAKWHRKNKEDRKANRKSNQESKAVNKGRICKEEGCDKPAVAKLMCHKHYQYAHYHRKRR